MTRRTVGRFGHGVAALAAITLNACGTTGASGTGDAAAHDESPASDASEEGPAPTIASAYVSAAVGPESNAACPLSGMLPFVTIGGPDPPAKPTTVADSSSTHISCTVSPSGDGFNVQATASVGTDSLTFSGHVTTAGGQDLSASFTESMFGTYAQTGQCQIAYSGDPTPVSPAVGPGRIWGAISCYALTNTASPSSGPDAGSPPPYCYGLAYFLFQGCGT